MSDNKYIETAGQMWYVLKATGQIEYKDGVPNFVR